MLSFFLRGMNMIDLAQIRKQDIQRGQIVLVRQKIHKSQVVPYVDQAQAIADKYANADNDYLLPLFHSERHKTPQQKYNRIVKMRREINDHLRQVCRLVGISDSGWR